MATIDRPVVGTDRASAEEVDDRWRGWTMLSGIAFTVLFVLGAVLGGDTPEYDAADAEWTEWFDDGGNRALQLVSLFLWALAALALVIFVTGLVKRLEESTGDRSGLPRVVFGAGMLLAASIAIGAVALRQMSAAIEIGDIPMPDADVLRTAEQLGFGVTLVAGGLFAALMVGAASLAARGTGVLPVWLVTAGFVVAVLLLFSVAFIPMILLPLWVLAAAILLGKRTRSTA